MTITPIQRANDSVVPVMYAGVADYCYSHDNIARVLEPSILYERNPVTTIDRREDFDFIAARASDKKAFRHILHKSLP